MSCSLAAGSVMTAARSSSFALSSSDLIVSRIRSCCWSRACLSCFWSFTSTYSRTYCIISLLALALCKVFRNSVSSVACCCSGVPITLETNRRITSVCWWATSVTKSLLPSSASWFSTGFRGLSGLCAGARRRTRRRSREPSPGGGATSDRTGPGSRVGRRALRGDPGSAAGCVG